MATTNEDESFWIIDGQKYDFTTLQHPGPSFIIQQTKRTDCTFVFKAYHTFANRLGPNKRPKLDKYLISTPGSSGGKVEKVRLKPTPIYDELQSMVRAHFAANQLSPKASWIVLLYYSFWILILLGSSWSFYFHPSISMGILLGFAWWVMADILHSSAHYALFHSNPTANTLAAYLLGWMHMNPTGWIRQHVLGHHVHANTIHDPDLYHHKVVRDSRVTGPALKSLYWIRMVIFIVTVAMLSGFTPQHQIFSSTKWYSVPSQYYPGENLLSWVHYSCYVTMLGLFVYADAYFALVPVITHSCLYHIFSQISHINEEAQAFNPTDEWAMKQFQAASGDYCHDSYFMSFLSIGLNLQSVHHLFPNVHWIHSVDLFPKIQKIIVAHGGLPIKQKTLSESVQNYMHHILVLN